MRIHRIQIALVIFALATLACQALTGGANDDVPVATNTADTGPAASTVTPVLTPDLAITDFPVTTDAYDITALQDGSVLYFTKMSQDEVMEFYRTEYEALGYTERTILTVTTDSTFSMVFDGDPSGEGIVIQGTDIGDGSRSVSVRREDV